MSKKRSGKVRKMTEQDYANYIMSLKDERPTKVIIPQDDLDKAKDE